MRGGSGSALALAGTLDRGLSVVRHPPAIRPAPAVHCAQDEGVASCGVDWHLVEAIELIVVACTALGIHARRDEQPLDLASARLPRHAER